MKTISAALEEYLSLRHQLGFELGVASRMLRRFAAFADHEGAKHITTSLVLRWTEQPAKAQAATWAQRVSMVRGFARWLSAIDSQTEVPPPGLMPYRYRRKPPYIYTKDEIVRLMWAAAELPSERGMRGLTYATLIGLVAVTGLRISEAIALDQQDVNTESDPFLLIRRTKFGKSRLVPLHQTTSEALARYAAMRDRKLGTPATPAFFLSERRRRITEWSTRYNWALICRQTGLRQPAGGYKHGRGPRLHDLRHRFASQTLIDWYRAGVDVEREIYKLSTYLGHTKPSNTYWYIEAVPELLQLATDRVVHRKRGGT